MCVHMCVPCARGSVCVRVRACAPLLCSESSSLPCTSTPSRAALREQTRAGGPRGASGPSGCRLHACPDAPRRRGSPQCSGPPRTTGHRAAQRLCWLCSEAPERENGPPCPPQPGTPRSPPRAQWRSRDAASLRARGASGFVTATVCGLLLATSDVGALAPWPRPAFALAPDASALVRGGPGILEKHVEGAGAAHGHLGGAALSQLLPPRPAGEGHHFSRVPNARPSGARPWWPASHPGHHRGLPFDAGQRDKSPLNVGWGGGC